MWRPPWSASRDRALLDLKMAAQRSTGKGQLTEDPQRAEALALDGLDSIAFARSLFQVDEGGTIYLDGNSLGMLPRRSLARVTQIVAEEWGRGLVRSWGSWVDLPAAVGDLLGEHLLGAAGGQTVVSDATTVNLYKLASAALDARPGRSVIVS
ncbi:MAG: hypothetical protein ACYDC5_11360, partial [Candidatus Dormibacteria bacterium]